MAIQKRYTVFKPIGENRWKQILSAATISKERGAIDQLYDHITTGPDGFIAIIHDTVKNRHVKVYRLSVAGITQLVARGGWLDGDAGVSNTIEEQIAELVKVIEMPNPDIPVAVFLSWVNSEFHVTNYIIQRPTEKQMKALRIANGKFLGVTEVAREEAALLRISVALSTDSTNAGTIKSWVGIWAECATDETRLEGDIEYIICGHVD